MKYSIEKERQIIGAIFHDNRVIPRIAEVLSVEDLYNPITREIYTSALEMFRESKPIEVVGFPDYYAEITASMNETVSPASAIYYAKELAEMARVRRIENCAIFVKETIDGGGDVNQAVEQFQQALTAKRTDGKSGKALVNDYQAEQELIQNKIANGEQLIGYSCGYNGIDYAIDGIRPGHFWIIGGYTSSGKSYLALNIAKNIIAQGKHVLYYSLEMSTEEIGSRLVGLISNLNPTLAIKGRVSDFQKSIVEEAKGKIYESKIKVFDSKRSIEEIRYSILGEHIDTPVDCVIIDYLQLLQGNGAEVHYETLRRASSDLQALGKNTKIPIIALSQINNESAKNESEIMGFKGSGDIAASADFALEIRVNETTSEELKRKQQAGEPIQMKLVIKKNRQGSKRQIDMLFNPQGGNFIEV